MFSLLQPWRLKLALSFPLVGTNKNFRHPQFRTLLNVLVELAEPEGWSLSFWHSYHAFRLYSFHMKHSFSSVLSSYKTRYHQMFSFTFFFLLFSSGITGVGHGQLIDRNHSWKGSVFHPKRPGNFFQNPDKINECKCEEISLTSIWSRNICLGLKHSRASTVPRHHLAPLALLIDFYHVYCWPNSCSTVLA